MAMPDRRPLPSWRDWMLLGISIVLVVAGAVLLASEEPEAGIVTLALFGSCLVSFAAQIRRKFRYRAYEATEISVTGGVPIRSSLAVLIGKGLWLIALGTIMIVFGGGYPLEFRLLAGGVVLAGVGTIVAVTLGGYATSFLQFDPEGLTYGERGWRIQVPWDRITAVREVSFHDNPLLQITVAELDSLAVVPAEATARARTRLAANVRWSGAPLAIWASRYGIDLPVLASAITHYVANPAARASLTRGLPQSPAS